jgi:hypothetical protein
MGNDKCGGANLFDPTVYENIKVVVEGAVYDLDLAGTILVTNRTDRVELSTMARSYSIQFQESQEDMEKETGLQSGRAEIKLIATIEDLSSEILELDDASPGCQMEILFYTQVLDIEKECEEIDKLLKDVWENRPSIEQSLSFTYGDKVNFYQNRISLDFGRKINEEQIEDIPTLVDLMFHTLQRLNQLRM